MVDPIFRYKFENRANEFIEIYENEVRFDPGVLQPETTIPLCDIVDVQYRKPGHIFLGNFSFRSKRTGKIFNLPFNSSEITCIENLIPLLKEQITLAIKQEELKKMQEAAASSALSSVVDMANKHLSESHGQLILIADNNGSDKIELFNDIVRISKDYKRNATVTDFYYGDIESVTLKRYGGVSSLTINTDSMSGYDDGKANTPNRIFFNDRNFQQFMAVKTVIESKLYEIRSKPRDVTTVIVKEIVKVPCPYCNTLVEVTKTKCPSCGAPQTRQRI